MNHSKIFCLLVNFIAFSLLQNKQFLENLPIDTNEEDYDYRYIYSIVRHGARAPQTGTDYFNQNWYWHDNLLDYLVYQKIL